MRIRLESEAKLKIQEEIRAGKFPLVWSYILDYENSRNPFQEWKIRVARWKKYANLDIRESNELVERANILNQIGLQKIDALHIACAIISKYDYFLSADNTILKRQDEVCDIKIVDPIAFINNVLTW